MVRITFRLDWVREQLLKQILKININQEVIQSSLRNLKVKIVLIQSMVIQMYIHHQISHLHHQHHSQYQHLIQSNQTHQSQFLLPHL